MIYNILEIICYTRNGLQYKGGRYPKILIRYDTDYLIFQYQQYRLL